MKKTLAIVLALVMILSLATTAFAVETTYSITINNDVAGYTYAAYQIFAGTLSNEASDDSDAGTSATLSDITWATGVTYSGEGVTVEGETEKSTKPVDIAAALAAGDLTLDALLTDLTLGEAVATASTMTDGKYVLSGLSAGYYLVKNTAVPNENSAYTEFIIEVVENSTVSPKADVPEVEKKIVDGNTLVDANDASIGDTVNYQITGTVANNYTAYNNYTLTFHDTLSDGLSYGGSYVVTLYKADGTVIGSNETNATSELPTGVTVSDGTDADCTLCVVVSGLQSVAELSTVVITYSATVDTDAIIGSTGNSNQVELEYSNDPNWEPTTPDSTQPTGEGPKDEVKTYVTELTINKVDGDSNALTGASFKIEGTSVNTVLVTTYGYAESENGTYYKLKDGTYTETAPTEDTADLYESTSTKYEQSETTSTKVVSGDVTAEGAVGEDGVLTFTGLGAGTYTITETVTPPGYNSVAPITVTINWTEDGGFTYTGTDVANKVNINEVTVINQSGSTLPETGGIGTTLFYIFGAVLVVGAAVLLVTKKRMSAEA